MHRNVLNTAKYRNFTWCGNFVETHSFNNTKLSEITVLYAAVVSWEGQE